MTPKKATETDPLLPSSSAPDANNERTISPSSTGRTILSLAIPAAAALLIDPLMTLADTAFVGHYSSGTDGATPLAGMGAAVAVLSFGLYLCNFLCTATTPLVASAPDATAAARVGGQALSLALTLGMVGTVVVWAGRDVFIDQIMGVTDPVARGYAVTFLTVRALAVPAVLTIEAATGILRGTLDTKTPVAVLVGANGVNFVLDVLLIAVWGWGPLGAAIATTTAEWISAGVFLSMLSGSLPLVGLEDGSKKKDDWVPVTPLRELPAWADVKPLIVASGSVLFRSLTLQLSLAAAAAMASRSATTSMAAHQIGIQLWLLCSFFCDSLAAASQGLVADALGRNDAVAVLDISKTVFRYSLVLGLFLAAVLQTGSGTGFLLDLFTKDPATQAALVTILPLIVIAQPLNSLVFAADGVLQGASQFSFQARAMAISGAAALCTFGVVERAEPTETSVLVHVWLALIALQVMRGLTSLWKLVDDDGPIRLWQQPESV